MELKEILKQVSAFFETTIANTREEILGPDNIRDITFNQYMYLQKIKEMNSPTYGQLAKELKVSKPAVTGIINKLIELDYIQRKKSLNDNRSYNLLLTKKALKRFKAEDKAYDVFSEYIKNQLSENETTQLKKLFNKIIKSEHNIK